jgi:hypothetical protein
MNIIYETESPCPRSEELADRPYLESEDASLHPPTYSFKIRK